jgi:hypothetical protein
VVQQYKQNLAKYALGRRVNMEEWNTRTGVAAGTIGFAAPVQAGPLGGQQIAALEADGVVLGITEAVAVLPRPGDQFEQYDNVPFCESGVIGVAVTGAVEKDAPAFWDIAEGTFAAAGEPIPGATFDEAGADDIVPLRYRRPNGAAPAAPAEPEG